MRSAIEMAHAGNLSMSSCFFSDIEMFQNPLMKQSIRHEIHIYIYKDTLYTYKIYISTKTFGIFSSWAPPAKPTWPVPPPSWNVAVPRASSCDATARVKDLGMLREHIIWMGFPIKNVIILVVTVT